MKQITGLRRKPASQSLWLALAISIFLFGGDLGSVHAEPATNAGASEQQRLRELAMNQVLYQFWSGDYYQALVSYQLAQSKGLIDSAQHQLHFAAIARAYGLAEVSEQQLQQLLQDGGLDHHSANMAQLELAQLYLHKADQYAPDSSQRHEFYQQAAQVLSQLTLPLSQAHQARYQHFADALNIEHQHFAAVSESLQARGQSGDYDPFVAFNLASEQFSQGQVQAAQAQFQQVLTYCQRFYQGHDANSKSTSLRKESYRLLADRALLALAEIELKTGNKAQAWARLQQVRTDGLYSNDALLNYSWLALESGRPQQAITALTTLSSRAISLAQVQEAKVLLAHVYEQQGAERIALRHYLLAEKDFSTGLEQLASLRKRLQQGLEQDSDQRLAGNSAGNSIGNSALTAFVSGHFALISRDRWARSESNEFYQQLSGYLVALLPNDTFQQLLHELRDLYQLREQLTQLQQQGEEQQRIFDLRQRANKLPFSLSGLNQRQYQLVQKFELLRLHSAGLTAAQQQQLEPQMQHVQQQFRQAAVVLSQLQQEREQAQQQRQNQQEHQHEQRPSRAKALQLQALEKMGKLQQEIGSKVALVASMISRLENLLHQQIEQQLEQHQQRMSYYRAQARLGKARLYDQALDQLNTPVVYEHKTQPAQAPSSASPAQHIPEVTP